MHVHRRWLVFFFLAFLAVTFCQVAIAGSGPGDGAPVDVYAGVWREGRAVFSDVQILDIFNEYPRGYAPEQPIKYSHKIHMGKAKMECTYCHSSVNRSSFATVPAVETCMGCHKLVLPDSPEIKKLAAAFKDKTPVVWEPVNNLAEYSTFNHERHIKGGVTCQSCHGLVQEMDVVEKVSALKMGWCVSCHRDQGVSVDCSTCHY